MKNPWEMDWGTPEVSAAPTETTTPKTQYSLDQLREALVGQESGGDYSAQGPTYTTKSGRSADDTLGEIAIGKYQIVPKYWFKHLGLNPHSAEDREMFRSNPELQDEAFGVVLQDALERFPDDQERVIANYYGGPGAARKYGTPEADEPQSGGMPSINDYVSQVLGRIKEVKAPWEMGWAAPESPTEVAPAEPPPEERPMVRTFINDRGGGRWVTMPGKTKSEQEAEDLAGLDAATQKVDDQARGREVMSEQARSLAGAFRTPEAISREKMEAVEPPSGPKGVWEKTKGVVNAGLEKVGDFVSGATQFTTGYAGRAIRGEGLEENLGRRARETEQIIAQKQRWESEEGKTFLAQAEAKAEKGQSLTLDEEEALAENPGFLASVKEFGEYAVNQPGKLAKEIGAQILEDGPFMVLSSYGVGSVLRAMRSTGSAYKAGRLALKAEKMGASPEVVARAARMGQSKEAAAAAERALGKSSLASKVGEEVLEDAAGAALVTLPKETAKGADYGGDEMAKDVLMGTFLGGPVGAFRHLKDTRVSRATVKGARKVAYLAGAEKHPYIQEMLPMFQALAENPETAGLRFKVSPDKKTISAEQAAAAYGPEYAQEFGDAPEVAGAAGRKKVTKAEAQAGALQKGEVGIYRAGDKETVVEEAAHYLQQRLRTKVQEEAVASGPARYTALASLVKEWEDRIRAAGEEKGVALPKGDELFAQVFTAHMGYADKFPQSVRRVVMPDGIFAGFKRLMSEDPELQGRFRPDGDITASEPVRPKQEAPAPPRKPASPLDGMEEGLAQAMQSPDFTKTGGKGADDLTPPAARQAWQKILDEELEAVMRGEARAAARSAAPRPEAKPPETPGVQILTPTRRAESPSPLPPRRPKEPTFQRRPLPPTEEPGLPPRRPAQGADQPSNFPPPYQEPEAMRRALNQAGRRPLEPLPEAPKPVEPDAPAAPAVPAPGPAAPPAAPAAAAAPLSGKKLGVSFRKFREAKAFLTKGEVVPKDTDVLQYLRELGDSPVPEKPVSTRRGTPLDKQLARTNEIKAANQVLRAGDESLETRVVKAKDLPPKFTTAGMEFQRVKTRDASAIRYKDTKGTTYDFRPDEDVHTGGEMGKRPAPQPVPAQGGARPTELDDDEPLPFQLKKGDSGAESKMTPEEEKSFLYKNGWRWTGRQWFKKDTSKPGKTLMVELPRSEAVAREKRIQGESEPKGETFQLKPGTRPSELQDRLSRATQDMTAMNSAKPWEMQWPRAKTQEEIDAENELSDRYGETKFQLKRGQPKTEQKDIFDNRGRVASQGFIKAKPNDKGTEGTPLFDAPDQEAQAKADEQQTSLFQLKPGEEPSKKEIVDVLKNHPLVKLKEKVRRAFLVGSQAKGEGRDDSDVDILLEVDPVKDVSDSDLTNEYRKKIQSHFARKGIEGTADHIHPQWKGRRVDVYFTYNADESQLPKRQLNDDNSQLKKQTKTPEFKRWFGKSKTVDEKGKPKVMYHGTGRPDRVGTKFQKSRATSGPMQYFTDDPEIASKYAVGKRDTSLEDEPNYNGWFKVRIGKELVDLDKAWARLSPDERTKIAEMAPKITQDDEGEIIVGNTKRGLGGYENKIQRARGNHLAALIDEWLSSGMLFNSEEDFSKVLTLAGLKNFEDDFPHATYPGVYPTYLSIQNPLVTTDIPEAVIQALEKASRRQGGKKYENGADQWDKNTQDPKEWMSELKGDYLAGKNSFAWTSVPDWVSSTLKKMGYDGIQDTGGKMGGQGHDVWVPFEPTQIKSATGNRGTFDPGSADITYQLKPAAGKRAEEGEAADKTPRVQERVESLRVSEAVLGQAPKDLDRETKRHWKDLDPEVQEILATWKDDKFYSTMKRRTLDDVEQLAWDARLKGKEELVGDLAAEYAKAKGTPDAGRVLMEWQAAIQDHSAGQFAAINDGTAVARALAARARIMAGQGKDTDAALVRKLTKEIPGITSAEVGKLVQILRTDPAAFPDALRGVMSSGWGAKALELWKAGLLSWIGTDIRNMGGAGLEQLTQLAERAVAGGVDWAIQKRQGGQRTRFAQDVALEARGMLRALPEAAQRFKRGMGEVFTLKDKPMDVGQRFDYQVGAVGGKLGKVARTSFRKLEVEDRFTKELVQSAELYKRAGWIARDEGLTGAALEKRIAVLIPDILKHPEKHAEVWKALEQAKLERSFQEAPGELTKFVLRMNQMVKPIQVVLPFVKTPSNILRRTLDRSPFSWGKSKRAYDAFQKAVKEGADDAEIQALRGAAADQIARTTLGTTLFGAFAGWAFAGGLTGSGPEDPDEKAALRETGWQPYSLVVHLPGTKRIYLPFTGFEPFSSLLGAAADFAESKNTETSGDFVEHAIMSTAENLINKSYLTGLMDLVTTVNDAIDGKTGAAGRYIARLGGTVVPAAVANVARLTDPTIRDTSPSRKGPAAIPERVGKTILSRLPGASRLLPARMSGTGGEARREGLPVAFGYVTAEKEGSEVFRELERIHYVPAPPPKEIQVPGMKGRKERLTEDERELFLEARAKATEKLKAWIDRPAWKNADDEKRKDLAKKIYEDAYEPVRKRVRLMVRRRALQAVK